MPTHETSHAWVCVATGIAFLPVGLSACSLSSHANQGHADHSQLPRYARSKRCACVSASAAEQLRTSGTAACVANSCL